MIDRRPLHQIRRDFKIKVGGRLTRKSEPPLIQLRRAFQRQLQSLGGARHGIQHKGAMTAIHNSSSIDFTRAVQNAMPDDLARVIDRSNGFEWVERPGQKRRVAVNRIEGSSG